jgi:hypothetical protein
MWSNLTTTEQQAIERVETHATQLRIRVNGLRSRDASAYLPGNPRRNAPLMGEDELNEAVILVSEIRRLIANFSDERDLSEQLAVAAIDRWRATESAGHGRVHDRLIARVHACDTALPRLNAALDRLLSAFRNRADVSSTCWRRLFPAAA